MSRSDIEEALEAAWFKLAGGPATQNAIKTQPIDISVPNADVCLAGIDSESRRALLIRVEADSVGENKEAGALKIDTVSLGTGGEFERYLQVMCTETQAFDLFDKLIVEMATAALDSPAPGRSALKVLSRWRDLFQSRGLRRLSDLQLWGLFGELVVLHQLFDSGAVSDYLVWEGPIMSPHDLELSGMSLEVKTVGAGSDSVHIHDIGQLEAETPKLLYLVVNRVDENSNGRSINDLLDDIDGRPGGGGIRNYLSKCGISTEDEGLENRRFILTAQHVVPVDDACPRIVAKSFDGGGPPAGVSRLEYEIALDELLPLTLYSSVSDLFSASAG